MGVRIHSVVKAPEYGSTISSDLTNDIFDIFYDAETGWIREDESGGEISRIELCEIIARTDEGDLKKALETLLKESDPDYEMVTFEMF